MLLHQGPLGEMFKCAGLIVIETTNAHQQIMNSLIFIGNAGTIQGIHQDCQIFSCGLPMKLHQILLEQSSFIL